MRCGEHFELEAALDGGGPSQAPRRAASQPPRDPPRRPGTPHSPPAPPTPRSTFPVAGGGWSASYCCERACASVPATLLSTAGLGVCQPSYYPRAGLDMPGRAAVRIRSTYERGWRLVASHSHACRRAALTYYIPIYTHGIIVNDACCNARARGLCESWRCGGVSCQSKQSLHLRRHRGDPVHTRDRQTRKKLISS